MSEIIGNRYALGNELGAGGMGTVYRGLDNQTRQTVAIKQLKSGIATPETIERFKREGESLRELNHPNIVKMLDMLEHDNQHYLVMEYVSGGDLKDLIGTHGKLNYQRCVDMAIDLADALTRAHRLNIIHRDLKPANVLIGDDGVLRLTDFGVAHVGSKERVTDTDAIVGTIDYLPPEAFEGGIFDARGDIWAFGVMLFEILAGQRPFSADTLMETLQAITTAPIPDLEMLCPDVPIALIDLIYRMLERNIDARIPSVRIVGAELEAIHHGRDKMAGTQRFDTDIPDFGMLPKHNLHTQTTPFVGREHELIELEKLLKDLDIRLITILAQGGMGKTRLCLELAQQAVDANLYTDGVYFVELAPLSDADNIPNAIGDAAGYQFLGEGSPKEQLLNIMKDRQLLLVLDNFEHLPEGHGLVTDILQACPSVSIVATSRERLSQLGETLFHLSGMDFPHWETPEDALDYAAVKLFMNSAKRAQPAFELTDDNLDHVARICRLVEGMPLGIVLAASWLSILSVEEIAHEIQGGLDFLETDETDLPERQRSIRAVMDYSWQQMTEAEQNVFMKLSVFRGGFTREAAESIAKANLRILMSLVKKSFIRRDTKSGRFEIHELLRQYADEHLLELDLHDAIKDTHIAYFSEFVSDRSSEITGRNQVIAMDELDADLDNIRAAWLGAIDRRQYDRLNAMIEGLFWYRNQRGHFNEAFRLGWDKLVTADDEQPHPVAMKMFVRIHEFRHTPIANIEPGLMIARQNQDISEIVFCTIALGFALCDRANKPQQALELMQDLIKQYRHTTSEYYSGYIDAVLSTIHYSLGYFDQSREYHLLWVESMKELDNKIQVAWSSGNLKNVTHDKRELALYNTALKVFREAKVPSGESTILFNLGVLAIREHSDLEQARDYFQQAINVALDINYGDSIVTGFGCLSILASLIENYRHALHLIETLRSYNVNSLSNAAENTAMAMVSCGHGDNETAHHYFLDNLRLRSVPCDLDIGAVLLAQKGQTERAVHLLGAQTPSSIGFPLDEWKLLIRLKSELKSELGEEAYQIAWERGKTLDLQTVVQELIEEFSDN